VQNAHFLEFNLRNVFVVPMARLPNVRKPTCHIAVQILVLFIAFSGFSVLRTFVAPLSVSPKVVLRSGVARSAMEVDELEFGQELSGTVTNINPAGLDVDLGLNMQTFMHEMNIHKDGVRSAKGRSSKDREKFNVGDQVKCFFIGVSKGQAEVTMLKPTGKPLSEFNVGDEIEGLVHSASKNAFYVDVGAYGIGFLSKK